MKEIIEIILLIISVCLLSASIFDTTNRILEYIVYIKENRSFTTNFLRPVIFLIIGLVYIIWYCN